MTVLKNYLGRCLPGIREKSELYAGSEINKTRLIFELEHLGYVKSQQLTKSGQFAVSDDQIVFFRKESSEIY